MYYTEGYISKVEIVAGGANVRIRIRPLPPFFIKDASKEYCLKRNVNGKDAELQELDDEGVEIESSSVDVAVLAALKIAKCKVRIEWDAKELSKLIF